MTVRCCRTYEEVHEGDIGRVTKLDRDGLHDLNVQVAWGARSAGAAGTYWVRYIHVELLSQPPGAVSSGGSGNLSPIKAVLWIRDDDFFRIRWGVFLKEFIFFKLSIFLRNCQILSLFKVPVVFHFKSISNQELPEPYLLLVTC
jgi:hypothetical protein